MPRFSILIPARDEEACLPRCLDSIQVAAVPFPDQVEIIVALNRCTDRTEEIALKQGCKVVREDSKNLARIRNAAARAATGEIVATIDADSYMSNNMLMEIDRMLRAGNCVGGGVMIWPERWSLGILVTSVILTLAVLWHRIAVGSFWCLREDFEAIGGFNENLVSVEDLDFAKRLKAYGKANGRRFRAITKAHIVTSCRKFDIFGDWHLVTHPGMVLRIFTGRSQKDADDFYYDIKR